MTESPKTTDRQRLQEFYWLILWLFLVFLGLAIPVMGLEPAWAGWIILLLGVIGTVSKGITLFRNSPIFILIEALDYFCLATIFAIGFVMILLNGGRSDFTWVFALFAIVLAFQGYSGLKKYKKSKAI
jgi:hypothetical protein